MENVLNENRGNVLTGWVSCSSVVPKSLDVFRFLGDDLVDNIDNLGAITVFAEFGWDRTLPIEEKTRVVILQKSRRAGSDLPAKEAS